MTAARSTPMLDEAASWVARMDAPDWSDANEAELQAWLDSDFRHRGALLQMQAAWMTLDPPAQDTAAPEAWDDTEESEYRGRASRRKLLAGGAAAIAASVAGGIFWSNQPSSFTTETGEIRRVPLADGSFATINTGSKVEIALGQTRREVRLDRGEAWFQVAKDRQRPFVVEAGRIRVQAVGTAFSVRRFSNGAEILVTEGVVEAWADGAEGNRARLTAGQRAFVADNAKIETKAATPSSVDRTLAWRAGKIDLVGETLGDAIAEFNRYNARKLVLRDKRLASEQFDGVFRIDDPAGFAVAVKGALSVPVDLSAPGEIRIGEPHS